MLRRLYSTFAGGWPGIGLLLMRLVIGAVVTADSVWFVLRPEVRAIYARSIGAPAAARTEP